MKNIKFRKDRVYEAIFISDVHYLLEKKIKNHRHKQLFQCLDYFAKRNIKFKNIYLGGDIIESWYFSANRKLKKSKTRFDKLFERFDRIALPGAGKYYMVGNHDTTSFNMKLSGRVERYLIERRWQVREHFENERFIVAHGHQGQYSRFEWVYSIFILRILHVLARIIPNLFQVAEDWYDRNLNRENPDSTEEKLKFFGRISRVMEQGNRLLICGHTHGFLCMPELKILNTGDWVEDATFIIQNKKKHVNRFMGIRMRSRKVYERVYMYELETGRHEILSGDPGS